MSDRMHPIPFEALLIQQRNSKTQGNALGIRRFYQPQEGAGQPYLGGWPETAVGPAAQVALPSLRRISRRGTWCGARVFEPETVQKLDGEDLYGPSLVFCRGRGLTANGLRA